jgi:hypothetical protein
VNDGTDPAREPADGMAAGLAVATAILAGVAVPPSFIVSSAPPWVRVVLADIVTWLCIAVILGISALGCAVLRARVAAIGLVLGSVAVVNAAAGLAYVWGQSSTGLVVVVPSAVIVLLLRGTRPRVQVGGRANA